jgi:phospholipase C
MAFANDPVRHVVVLMLENRSFDHLLGDLVRIDPARGIQGIDRNNPGSNPMPDGSTVKQAPVALARLPDGFDPKHELPNVKAQLGDFAAPTMSGFVADGLAALGKLSKPDTIAEQVMGYFPAEQDLAKDPLPALRSLARHYTVCDRWHAALPGPTWPNRFFALCGTAAGHVRMPNNKISDVGLLFKAYDMDTIFDRLRNARRSHRIFHNGVALSMLLHHTWPNAGIYGAMDEFHKLAQGKPDDFPEFSFIEPKYFSVFGSNQNDQHPPHDIALGDALIAEVYNALRSNEALWQGTLLVVLYDEHGGFYDHVVPPTTVSPDNIVDQDYPDIRFDFKRLGVRVPALLVSPHVRAGAVDHQLYDHTSLLAYLCRKWDMPPLGARCAQALDFSASIQFNVNPQALPSINLPKQRVLRAPVDDSLINGNQRALALMVDFIRGEIGLDERPVDPAPGTKALSAPPSGDQVERKAREALQWLQSQAAATAVPREQPKVESSVAPPGIAPGEGGMARPLKVLMVHGVGHRDDPGIQEWKQQWQDAFSASARAAGLPANQGIEFEFAEFDDIFVRYPLDAATIARGLLLMARSTFGSAPVFGQRDLVQPGLFDSIRWTAGMTVQWIESESLRDELSNRIMQSFLGSHCDIVCAHSFGSLACYDAFRRKVADPGGSVVFDGCTLVTFGSQIAHLAVQSVFGGRIEPVYDAQGGFAQWFHLFNPHDHMFTEPLPGGDARTHSLLAAFELPLDRLNHDGAAYLKHDVMAHIVLPSVVPRVSSPPAASLRAVPALMAPRRASRRALLVGINEYPDPQMRLNGCVNDVYLISAILQECGFDADDIRVLTDGRATREAMLERLEWLADGVGDGDERIFFYSGHGAQMPLYGLDKPSQIAETLVPADFDWSEAHAFTDKDFRRYYSHLPYGSQFVALFDCCHAGGMTRGGQRVRGIDPPDDVRHRALRWSPANQMWVPRDFVETTRGMVKPFDISRENDQDGRSRYPCVQRSGLGEAGSLRLVDKGQFDDARRRYGHQGPYLPLLVFAAGQNQLAAEYDHGATAYGAFTFAMAKRLRQSRKPPSFATLIAGVRKEMAQLGYQQTPSASGPRDKLDQVIPMLRWRESGKQ